MILKYLGVDIDPNGKPRASGDDPYARILTRLVDG